MADEARAMLDALMGGDRNAPLPQDTAAEQRLGPTKRSCRDRDICPLYCAWGVDVYELFRNTKSDTLVGVNPNVVDDAAHEEYKSLPKQEQERLGYHAMLFRKLQELVQRCDRTVNRNKEKLRQEMAKQLQKRGGQDFVQDVDDGAVAQLASSMVRLEFLEKDIVDITKELEEAHETETNIQSELEELKQKEEEENSDGAGEKKEVEADEKESDEAGKKEEETSKEVEAPVTDEKDENTIPQQTTEAPAEMEDPNKPEDVQDTQEKKSEEMLQLEQSLETARINKQRLLVSLRQKVAQHQPLEESIQSQRRHLEYVKSDITSDKTVCEVSGNFMSSRDADERIAAHYAGKQYVGWKLVRDKLKDMIKEYGRYGPPGGDGGPRRDDYRQFGRGGYHGGGRDRNYDRDRSRDRGGYRGGGRQSPQYWERDRGGGGSRGYDRGGGGGGDWRRDRGGGRDNQRHWRR